MGVRDLKQRKRMIKRKRKTGYEQHERIERDKRSLGSKEMKALFCVRLTAEGNALFAN